MVDKSQAELGRPLAPVLAVAALIAATTIVLRAMGRSWWCHCGSPIPWAWDIWSSHNSQHLLDPYSLTHGLHGVILFAVISWMSTRLSNPAKLWVAVVIECGWEILENSPMIIDRYRAATISLDYYGDSIANSVSDILACVAGYFLASLTRPRWWVAIIVGVELFLLVTIRDCLTLNIIMLVYPMDAIKAWQTGAM